MSIQKTSPLPSLKYPYSTITNMTSNCFNLDSPSVLTPTHNIGSNPLSISNLNPFLYSDTQQFHNHPSTSQLFNIISSSNPLTSHSIPHTTISPFSTPTTSSNTLSYTTHNPSSPPTNPPTFQEPTQTFNPPFLRTNVLNTQSLPTTHHSIVTTQPLNPSTLTPTRSI